MEHIVEDINGAIVWVKENGEDVLGIDSSKMAIVESSPGGYLSLLSGTFDDMILWIWRYTCRMVWKA